MSSRHPLVEEMVQYERWQDDLRAAAYSRLIKEAEQGQALYEQPVVSSMRRPLTLRPLALALAQLLAFVGRQMVSWSCRLRVRYTLISGTSDTRVRPC